MPIGPARMPLLDHLGELRRRAFIIVLCLLITMCVLYFLADKFVLFLVQPIAEYLPDGAIENGVSGLTTTKAFEGFTVKFGVSIFGACVMCSPIIFWEILAFFLPALKPNERKYVIPTFAIAVVLFIVGVLFCYNFCLGAAFKWLIGESLSIATVLASASDYIKFIVLFLLAFGLAFELPLVIFYLILFNLLPYEKIRKNWRIAYVALLVFSAMVTPDASPVTMFIMFAALVILFEASMLAARIVLSRKIKKQKQEELAKAQ